MQDSTIVQNYTEQVIQQAINVWAAQNKTVTNFFNKYDDAAYMNEIAPGKNRAIYLLGHLIAVNDGMQQLFMLGERLFPQYDAIFIKAADKTVTDLPSIQTLKEDWEKLNIALADHFGKMTTAEWIGRHASVSEEDFAKEPLRNKLNVLFSRTNHQSYHMGQLNLMPV
ncbi:DinB family protein [Taibaiella lutea]|uniref:DinB family protein n=1 Tax=Taibaiella lutea TaxID=2608001 RepID=A0A5M6CHX4_9BACT|nr:DinB family protein [Taibaiella lutea]KAA5534606.1 DinB family protein [Taibaiella lutea]